MESAYRRARTTVPKDVSDLYALSTTHGGPLALRCFRHGCPGCTAFDANGRDAYEKRLGRRYAIRPWNCGGVRMDVALKAGVEKIPAYILVDGQKRSHRVVYPVGEGSKS